MAEVLSDSRIRGGYTGWIGNTIYELDDGTIWKQKGYRYHYHYAYRPEVKVVDNNGTLKMYVFGDEPEGQEVVRIR